MNWVDLHDRLLPAKNWIVQNQLLDGSIPWDEKGKCDAWDHSECLISLAIYKEWEAFDKGVDWFFSNLNSQGLIYSEFNNQQPTLLNYQSHHAPYIALPLLQRYLIDKNLDHLNKYLPQLNTIFSSLLDFMDTDGMYYWSKDDNGYADNSLITASMSIAISVQAYTSIIEILDLANEKSDYDTDLKSKSLKDLKTLLDKSFWSNSEIQWDKFDRDGVDRSRFSMDFYYPYLAGIKNNKSEFLKSLESFYVKGLGVKCVKEEPWVTVAESCECVIAALAHENIQIAEDIFNDIQQFQDSEGIFPTGYQYDLKIFWPEEKSTWTNAAVIIAAHALTCKINTDSVEKNVFLELCNFFFKNLLILSWCEFCH